MNSNICGLIAIVLYVVATTHISRQLLGGRPNNKQIFLGLGAIAFLFHGFALKQIIFTQAGIDLGFFAMASLVAWLIAALAMITSLYRPVESLALGAYPIAALALLCSLLFESTGTPKADLSQGIVAHILSSILAYSVLTIAAFHSVLLALQNRQLKHGHIKGVLGALPPIQSMEALLFEFIWVGIVLLSIAIVTGFFFVDDLFAQHLVHKSVLTICAWVIFSVLLTGRHYIGWRGPTAIRWTIAGFAMLMIAFFGSKLVLELIL